MTGGGAALGSLAVLLLAGAGPDGCSDEREVAVRSLGVGAQCGGAGEGASVRRLVAAAEVTAALSPGLGAEPTAPVVNWATEAVLLVSGGQRTSAGYGVALGSNRAQVKDGAAGLRISFSSPPAGAINAQVMTSPCLVVALPRQGLRAVAVLDGERAAATVKLE